MQIETNIALAPLTTLRVGGPAAAFIRVQTLNDLQAAAAHASAHKLPTLILGEGSNLLIPDAGFAGVVIKNELHGVSFVKDGKDVLAVICAGENWDAFVGEAVKRGFHGIENLSGIPGTVGATPIQNVGAYGTEVSDVIQWVEVYDTKNTKLTRLNPEKCNFLYRDSIFKQPEGKHYIVTSVCFRLSQRGSPNLSYHDLREQFTNAHEEPTLSAIRTAVLTVRAGKFPSLKEVGTAGSFFKNPILIIILHLFNSR